MDEEVKEVEETKNTIIEEVGKFDDVIEAWFSKHFHGLNVETEIYNKMYRAKDDLKNLIKG